MVGFRVRAGVKILVRVRVGVRVRVRATQVALVIKNPSANSGDPRDLSLIPGSGISLAGRYGDLLQYSCLDNPMDRGSWWAIVHGVTKIQS